MPLSLPLFDEELELYFRHAAHDSVLDIGPGEGKFGKLLRRVQPTARRLAVEVDAGYVEQYRCCATSMTSYSSWTRGG